jgi:hypothetical protein
MIQQMNATQLFCLSNWEAYRSSLHMQLTAAYTDGTVTEIPLELSAAYDSIENGLLVMLQPENSLFLLGILSTDSIRQVTLRLESALGTVRSLNLRYALAEADEAYSDNIPFADTPLSAETLVFTPHGEQIAVEFSTAAMAQEQPVQPTESVQPRDAAELLGDIAADLRMLSCYNGAAAAREAVKALACLRNSLEQGTISIAQAEDALAGQERVLVSCIDATQADLQSYRAQIVNETDGRGK